MRILNCRKVAQFASEYLENRLSSGNRWRVRLHLLMCSRCRRYMRQMELTTNTLRRLEPPPSLPTPDELDQLIERLYQALQDPHSQ